MASAKERQVLVDSKHTLSLNKQCRLLHVNKSSLYYKPTKPFNNSRDIGIYEYLLKEFRNYAGQIVIDSINKVWSTDITYIKLEKGFVYLAAVIDWYSKKILSWQLSNTMDISLVTDVLKDALALYPKPEIFNTDQGSQ